MGKYDIPFSLRISEELLNKVKYTAKMHSRSTNKEMEFILKRYIYNYEKQFGQIELMEKNIGEKQ